MLRKLSSLTLGLCLIAGSGLSYAQDKSSDSSAKSAQSSQDVSEKQSKNKSDKQKQQSKQQQKQKSDSKKSDQKSSAEKNQNSSDKNQSKQDKNQSKQDKQSKQSKLDTVDVSLDEGRTIAIPEGSELLSMTVAVPDNVRSGQKYIYRTRIQNNSDTVTLTDVQVVQIGGASVDVESSSPKQAKQSKDGDNRTWALGKLKPGESKNLTVHAVAGKAGNAEHCFAVKYQETLCLRTEVTNPNVQIAKSGPDEVGVCEEFEYRYELTNTGSGMARNFVITDQLPKGVMTESGKETLEFRVDQLAEGETRAFLASVYAMKAGEFGSRATVEQKDGSTNQSQKVSTKVIEPELDVAISGPRAIKAGEGGSFDVTVTNTSDIVAYGTELTLSANSKNAEFENAGNGDARNGGEEYRYQLGDLEPGQEEVVSVTMDANSEGELKLKAKATSVCALDEEEILAEASANLNSRVLEVTSLLLSIVDTDDVIPVGNTVTYRVQVRNQGDVADKNVKLNLKLPNGLEFASADGPTDAKANGSDVDLGTVKKLNGGESLEWQVTVNARQEGEQIVEAVLESEALKKSVKGEEVSTIYDARKRSSK